MEAKERSPRKENKKPKKQKRAGQADPNIKEAWDTLLERWTNRARS